jgi:hypothetical protein
MIITGVLLGLVILFAVCIVFWFMRGTHDELKDAGVHLDKNLPWPFPIAMPQHDVKPKRKPALKKATTVVKKKTAVKKPVTIKAKPKTKK